jgi:hypothetical protein
MPVILTLDGYDQWLDPGSLFYLYPLAQFGYVTRAYAGRIRRDIQLTVERKSKIAVLHAEADAIHSANKLFWKLEVQSSEDKAEYGKRRDRIEAIRRDLADLRRE